MKALEPIEESIAVHCSVSLLFHVYIKCVCFSGFIQKQSLIRHERIHSGYKPYTCAQCSRVFTDSATIRKHMILVHKSDPHDWQGDVISDLKKQGELWQGDLTSEPKKEPDFRRKADRERLLGSANTTTNTETTNNENLTATPTNELSHGNEDSMNDMNHLNSQNNIHGLVANEISHGGSNNVILEDNSNPETSRQSDYWRGDTYTESHRPVETWHSGNVARQPEPMRVDSIMGLKRADQYYQQGMVVDTSRHSSEYFHGDNIPDPRKQIEFWQGQTIPDGKQHSNDQMHSHLTTLQNMNYHSQS